MSYFSDLSVAKMESANRDNSYPCPLTQIVIRIEDIVSGYLQSGGDFNSIEVVFEQIDPTVSDTQRELLYSTGSESSPSLLMKSLRTALSILEQAEDDEWNCAIVLTKLKQMFLSEHEQKKEKDKYAA